MATQDEKAALGLPPDATDDQIAARIKELTEQAQSAGVANSEAADAVRAEMDAEIAELQERLGEAEARASEAETAAQESQSAASAALVDLNERLAAVEATQRQVREDKKAALQTSVTGESAAVPAHNVAQASDTNEFGLLEVPGGNQITIKIRAFPYYVDVEDPITLRPMRQEVVATRGQTTRVSDVDYRRASKFGAFYTDEELAALKTEEAQRASQLTLADATIADISNWLQVEKPTVPEVLDEVNNDPEVAAKVIQAEHHATGGQPRSTLIDELELIANG